MDPQPSKPECGNASKVKVYGEIPTQTARSRKSGLSMPAGRRVDGRHEIDDHSAFDDPLKTGASLQKAECPNALRNGGRVTRKSESRSSDSGSTWRRRLIALFIVSLVIPWIFSIGPARMSVYRLTLCITILPCAFLWVTGRTGKMRIADFAVILFSCWRAASFFVMDGSIALQTIGISFVETLGAYFLARACVRSADDFRAMAKTLFVVIAVMMPFALIEATTGSRVILKVFGTLLPTYQDFGMEFRAGLVRVQGPFDHSILFGAFCSTGFALTFLVVGFRNRFIERYGKAGIVAFTAALSLSAGPVLGIAIQCMLIAWKRLADAIGMKLLSIVTITSYLVVQGIFWVANRSMIEFVVGRLTFDPMSYWSRNLIFEYAWHSVANHPLFGTAMGRWDRPLWMPASIDNFWLAFAVMNGIPSALLLALAVLFCVVSTGWKSGLDEKQEACRTAYIIAVLNWCLVGMTVYYWDAAYVLFLLLLGSGLWIRDSKPDAALATGEANLPRSRLQKTRALPVHAEFGGGRRTNRVRRLEKSLLE